MPKEVLALVFAIDQNSLRRLEEGDLAKIATGELPSVRLDLSANPWILDHPKDFKPTPEILEQAIKLVDEFTSGK